MGRSKISERRIEMLMDDPERVQADWPRTTRDNIPGRQREWIHEPPPRYYLYRTKEGMWVVIDRVYDLADGRYYKRKCDCIRAFVYRHRPKRRAA